MWISVAIYSITAGLITLVGILTLSRLSIFEDAARWADEHLLGWTLLAMFCGGAASAAGMFLMDESRALSFVPLVVTFTLLGSTSKRMQPRTRRR